MVTLILTAKPQHVFELTGGVLCLDFVNTVDHRHDPQRFADHLESYGDVLSFAEQSGVLSRAERTKLEKTASRNLAAAHRTLQEAVRLREGIYRIFAALAAARQPAADDLRLLNRHAQTALRHMRLQPADGGFGWGWQQAPALDAPLWRIAKSAADLLISGAVPTVRECAAETCGWLFLDRSRNRTRRWCDMRICGNRAKARRHYSLLTRSRRRPSTGFQA